MNAQWLPLRGFDYDYRLNQDGQVWSPKLKRPLRLKMTRDGYLVVRLTKNGKSFCTGIHRLLALYFIGDPPAPHYVVNHKNGIKTDNRLQNLEWCTNQQNIAHFIRELNGSATKARGIGSNKKAKFYPEEVHAIRSMRRAGKTYKQICTTFDHRMSIQGCRAICLHKTYAYISD